MIYQLPHRNALLQSIIQPLILLNQSKFKIILYPKAYVENKLTEIG